MDLVGKRVDRYKILGTLGRGASGAVFRAYDPLLEREVALKILHRSDPQAVARFEREQRACTRLQHPNLVAVHDVGVTQGLPFIVMELVPGQTLGELIEEVGPPAPQRAAQIVRDVARAIAYAHEQGVLHRDIKPANVLLTLDGDARVVDFGLASAGDRDTSLTQTGALIGTPSFMSPEQAAGLRADAQSDVYGLGSTLYCLLTGRPPFLESPLLAIHRRDVDPPRVHNPSVPQALEAICLQALAREPADRTPDAATFAQALDRFLTAPEPVEAEAPTGHAALVPGLAVLVLGLVLVLLFLSLRDPAPPSAVSTAPSRAGSPSPTPTAASTPQPSTTPPARSLPAALAAAAALDAQGAPHSEVADQLDQAERLVAPDDLEARANLRLARGRLARRRLQLTPGIRALTPLVERPGPHRAEACVLLATLYLHDMRPDQALALLRRVPAPADAPWGLLQRSIRAHLERDRQAALAAVHQALARHPLNRAAGRWLAFMHAHASELGPLSKLLPLFLEQRPPDGLDLLLASGLASSLAQPAQARSHLLRAWALCGPERSAGLVAEAARLALDEQTPHQALVYLDHGPREERRSALFHLQRGAAYDQQLLPEQARVAWRRAFELDPPLVRESLAAHAEPARRRIQRALGIPPNRKIPKRTRDVILHRAKQMSPRARAAFKRVFELAAQGHPLAKLTPEFAALIRADPSSAYAQTWVGLILLGRGALLGARTALRSALNLHWSPVTALGLALAELRARNLTKAKGILEEILQRSPNSVPGLCARAALFRLAGRNAEALAACDQALATTPTHVPTLTLKSQILADVGRHAEGVQVMRIAAKRTPWIDAHPHSQLAQAALHFATQRRDAEALGRAFRQAEQVMATSACVQVRLSAANASFLLAPTAAWAQAAWDWIWEAERQLRTDGVDLTPIWILQGRFLTRLESALNQRNPDADRTGRVRARVDRLWGKATGGLQLPPTALAEYQSVFGEPYRRR